MWHHRSAGRTVEVLCTDAESMSTCTLRIVGEGKWRQRNEAFDDGNEWLEDWQKRVVAREHGPREQEEVERVDVGSARLDLPFVVQMAGGN